MLSRRGSGEDAGSALVEATHMSLQCWRRPEGGSGALVHVLAVVSNNSDDGIKQQWGGKPYLQRTYG